MLPVGALKCLIVKDGVDQVDLQPGAGACIVRNLVLHKIPNQPHDFVIALVFLGAVPRQQAPVMIDDRLLPRELGINPTWELLLGKGGGRKRRIYHEPTYHDEHKPARHYEAPSGKSATVWKT